jgi:L-threonylcarbamoyladenylate synthase
MKSIKTTVLKVDPHKPEPEKIRIAAEVLNNAGLVAFPTETVYGLGANALNEKAVLRIFEAKNRPTDNPIIVHIANRDDIYVLAEHVPQIAEGLIDEFWPGPLTLLFAKSDAVPSEVTAGLATVAIRMPSHAIANALISEAEVPVAAPSANLAGKPSPTSAKHVLDDLFGRIEVLIDGGEVGYGVESTVLDLTTDPPAVLRPGPITVEELRKFTGEVDIHPIARADVPIEVAIARSPGMKYRHYAPAAEVVVVEGPEGSMVQKVQELIDFQSLLGKRVGVMAMEETAQRYRADVVKVVGSRFDPRTVAKNLFKVFREFDSEDVKFIAAESLEPKGIGLAVMNRLRKAAGYKIVRVK